MDASQNCIDLIHGSEGFYTKLPDGRYKSYLDKLPKTPVWTIYCGLTKGVGPDTVWTVEQCEKAFSKEMNVYEDAVDRMVTVQLNQNQFDALVSLVYNIGPGSPSDSDKKGFYWSTLRRLLNEGKYEAAASQFHRYKYAGGVVYKGLVTRRANEAALFLEPVSIEPVDRQIVDEAVPLPQTVEAGPVASVGQVISGSSTIKGAALALGSTIAGALQGGYDWVFGIAKEAGPEIVGLKTTLTPFDALLKLTPAILIALTVIGLTVVIVRRLKAGVEGTHV